MELRESAALQLSEYEMLHSMFPEEGELSLSDPGELHFLRLFSEGKLDDFPTNLEFTVTLVVEEVKFIISVSLPCNYPVGPPEIYVRADSLSRDMQSHLNKDLSRYLQTFEDGDLRVGPAVTWLQENAVKYCRKTAPDAVSGIVVMEVFLRLWLYSHHIYSKIKRKDMMQLSKDYNLTGFCLPGKPGIVCVEGEARNVEDFWQLVRSWNWKKIVATKREEQEVKGKDLNHYRRFPHFEELGSKNDIKIKSDGCHIEMGDFYRYLEKHKSSYMFKEYFGVDGQ